MDICDREEALMHTNKEVYMYIEWPGVIVDLVIITKEFLGGYCILLGNLMYGITDLALLWIILLAIISSCRDRKS